MLTKLKLLLAGLGALILVGGLTRGMAAAQSNQSVSGTTNASIYKYGQTVNVSGTVNGDIYCAGQTVNIDATVNGDVLCAGQSVDIGGTVHGNIRAAGQSVTVTARVDKAVTLVAQTATIASSAEVGNDYSVAATSATMDGSIGRDIHATVGDMTVNGTLSRNLYATVNNLTLQSQARIEGNVNYSSPNKLQKDSDALIGGTIMYHKQAAKTTTPANAVWNWGGVMFRAGAGFGLLVSSLILVALFPQYFRRANSIARERSWPWAALLTGFVAVFVVPIILAMLALLTVTLPLAFIGLFAWLIALMLAAPLAAYYVGCLLVTGDRHSPVLIVLVGGIILWLLALVPILDWIITLLAVWYGTGLQLIVLKRTYRRPNYETS